MRVSLRTHTPEDFETLYQIDHACYEPAIAYSRRELGNYLRFPGADCVVVEAGSTIAGFCITAHQGARGYIVTMDVLEKCRRQGLGGALLREVERRLGADGVREIGLETATDNETAIAFWQKHGYRTSSVAKGYYPGGRDAYTMIKIIGREKT